MSLGAPALRGSHAGDGGAFDSRSRHSLAWLADMPPRRTHYGAPLATLAVAAVLLCGCDVGIIELRPALPPPTIGATPLTPLSTKSPEVQAKEVMAVRLRMMTLQLPMGTASSSEEIWSYLDEEALGAAVHVSLAYNGLRAGMGTEANWPDVARVLRRLAGRSLQRSHAVATPGSSLPIVLNRFPDKQTIFTFRADRTLVGRDYPPGDNLLVMATGIDWDNPSAVYLSCTPVVRTAQRRRRYLLQNGRYVVTDAPDYLPIHELRFSFTVPPGGFILIGPGTEVRRESSPGNHFLIRRKKGVPFETVLVIAPEVFAAPVRSAATGSPPR